MRIKVAPYIAMLGVGVALMLSLIALVQSIDREWRRSFEVAVPQKIEANEEMLICDGNYKDGSKPTKEALKDILVNHSKWLIDPKDGRRANLCNANLEGADLEKSNLQGANLLKAVLRKANLSEANLSRANLDKANLKEASLGRANLTESNLAAADLSDAFLANANLSRANLVLANLKDTNLFWTNLDSVIYEVSPGMLPHLYGISTSKHLESIKWIVSPGAMLELREAFKKAGMRTKEREITYAIKRSDRLRMGPIESAFSWLLFDLTCQYGMEPLRPSKILLFLVLIFGILYAIALRTEQGAAGIWAVWPANRVNKAEGEDKPTRVTADFFFSRTKLEERPTYSIRLLCGSLYFSLLSAFNIGWKELTLGNWLIRLQTREYVLQATGWVRTVSGFQSIISVYLVALLFLSYFGRPFEN